MSTKMSSHATDRATAIPSQDELITGCPYCGQLISTRLTSDGFADCEFCDGIAPDDCLFDIINVFDIWTTDHRLVRFARTSSGAGFVSI